MTMTFATHSTAKSLTTEVLNEPFSQRINPIDAYLNTHAQAGQFSGSVAIAHPKEGTITRSYGQANREHEVPNHAQTKFRIGSLTKQFTAVSILQLQERGLLNVQSPLSAYLPNYPQGKKITVHHLLTHLWHF